jgi:hypothetical protein
MSGLNPMVLKLTLENKMALRSESPGPLLVDSVSRSSSARYRGP